MKTDLADPLFVFVFVCVCVCVFQLSSQVLATADSQHGRGHGQGGEEGQGGGRGIYVHRPEGCQGGRRERLCPKDGLKKKRQPRNARSLLDLGGGRWGSGPTLLAFHFALVLLFFVILLELFIHPNLKQNRVERERREGGEARGALRFDSWEGSSLFGGRCSF